MTVPIVDQELVRRRIESWVGPSVNNGVDPFATWWPPKIDKPARVAGKAIIICCDGTGNHPKQTEGDLPAATNVYLLYEALSSKTQFGTQQITWYDPGVGTGTSRVSQKAGLVTRILRALVKALPAGLTGLSEKFFKLFEGATGAWIEENIEQGYREIVKHYEPGDGIFLFGFSRGAYTARCIAGVIDRCGLLKSENVRFVPEVMTLYRRRRVGAQYSLVDPSFIHDPRLVKVEVLGLWDTVASLGLPLWGWWFRIGQLWRNQNLDSNPASICKYVYHAMSMDERRSQFFPTVTTPPPGSSSRQYVQQTWFRGAHADIGGGYGNRTLGDIGLEWMLQIAHFHGLSVRTDLDYVKAGPNNVPICPKADPMGYMHDEMERVRGWAIFGGWPRWAPVYRPYWRDRFQDTCAEEYGTPHELVYRRAEEADRLWRRRVRHLQAGGTGPAVPGDALMIDQHMARDGLIFLNVGQAVEVKVDANRIWTRTAVVFESAALYRIAYVNGEWRDQEKPACLAPGQKPAGADLARRIFHRSKRKLEGDWLELFGHVAHPRRWPVAEFGLFKLMQLLFWRSPLPLSTSLIQLGRHMAKPKDSVCVVNLSHNGIFYAFANDAWATYQNNSGAVTLRIERIAAPDAGGVLYAVTPRGEVVPEDSDVARRRTFEPGLQALIDLVARRSAVLAQSDAQRAWPDGSEKPAATGISDFPSSAVAFQDISASPDRPPIYDGGAPLADIDRKILDALEGLRPVEERNAPTPKPKEEPPAHSEDKRRQRYVDRDDSKRARTKWSLDWGRDEA